MNTHDSERMGLKDHLTLWLLALFFLYAGFALWTVVHPLLGVVCFAIAALLLIEGILDSVLRVWEPDGMA